jgi:glycosyltransferase involved in cell wall biosynthesis
MQRYWLEIDRIARHQNRIAVRCPLGTPHFPIRAHSRLIRAAKTYLLYPLRAELARDSQIFHILDHSFSHLVTHVPRRARTLVTVHDVLPLRDPSGLSNAQVARFRSRLEQLKHADILLASSCYTKSEVVDLLGIEPARIAVNYLGVSEPTRPQRPADPLAMAVERLKGRVRILSIGNALRRKNLEVIPDVVARLQDDGLDASVVRIGSHLHGSLKHELESRLGQGQLVECGIVSDEVLSWLYANVEILLFPSLLEGFGLPVLEAMAHGCAVVCSNATSLPEVAGDAAAYFSPDQPEEAAAQIARVVQDTAFGDRLRSRGLERARLFSWHRHFEQLATCYEGLAAEQSLSAV